MFPLLNFRQKQVGWNILKPPSTKGEGVKVFLLSDRGSIVFFLARLFVVDMEETLLAQ